MIFILFILFSIIFIKYIILYLSYFNSKLKVNYSIYKKNKNNKLIFFLFILFKFGFLLFIKINEYLIIDNFFLHSQSFKHKRF